ncbi:helix-turn-helix domain-containing protein [[Pseudomonas] boreopolis]|uniref:HTH cro/C1-type domain-containing protein n=1 Tax=Xanthomonas boreopolis TaxID=86183 RepID=A0A919KHW6_9XANT|nr:hypothetical protein GCM10009090_16280 [[Pseudomonas] boreopolis]
MVDPRLQSLAERLKRLIEQSEFNAAEVAREVGVDKSTVSKWMSGERTPTMKNLMDLADLLGVEMRDLWEGPTSMPSTPEQRAMLEHFGRLPLARQQAYLALIASETSNPSSDAPEN